MHANRSMTKAIIQALNVAITTHLLCHSTAFLVFVIPCRRSCGERAGGAQGDGGGAEETAGREGERPSGGEGVWWSSVESTVPHQHMCSLAPFPISLSFPIDLPKSTALYVLCGRRKYMYTSTYRVSGNWNHSFVQNDIQDAGDIILLLLGYSSPTPLFFIAGAQLESRGQV